MNIPQSFKDAQKKAFQDKSIQHYTKTPAKDSEGHVIPGTPTLVDSHTANVVTISDKLVAEAWGLKISRDILVTSSEVLNIPRNALVKYLNVFYEVIGDESRDAYTALYCRRYET